MGEPFTEDFKSKLPGWDKSRRNPQVVALCKRADPELDAHRRELEAWYSHLPDRVKRDFCKRLRSKKTHTHLAAVYELFFHEYFLQKEWEVTHHPPLKGLTPDFLVRSSDGDILFYCEVSTIFSSKDTQDWERRIDVFQTRLMKTQMQPGFALKLNYEQIPMANFDHRAVIGRINEWLRELPRVEGEWWELPIDEGALVGQVQARYYGLRTGLRHAFLGSTGPSVWGNEAAKRLRERVDKKSKKYRAAAGTPIILAMCDATSLGGLDPYSVVEMLYGTQKIVLPVGPHATFAEATAHRQHDGAYTRENRDRNGFKRPNLSAVFVCARARGGPSMQFRSQLYHNVHAHSPLGTSLFSDIPQFTELSRDGAKISLGWIGEDLGPIQLGAGSADD